MAMQKTPLNEDLSVRLFSLIESIMKTIYTNVTRGLFGKDRLIFSFMICTSINKNSGKLKDIQWNTFLRGAGLFEKARQPANPDKTIIT